MMHIFVPSNYVKKSKHEKKGGIFIPDLSKPVKNKNIQQKSGFIHSVNVESKKPFGVERIEKNKNKVKKIAESDLMNNFNKDSIKDSDNNESKIQTNNDTNFGYFNCDSQNDKELIENVKKISLQEYSQNNQNMKKSNLQKIFEDKIEYDDIKMLEKLEEDAKMKEENKYDNNFIIESNDSNKDKGKGKGNNKKNKAAANLNINLKFG